MIPGLRLYPPGNVVPKVTRLGPPQTLKQGDREFIIPGGTRLNLQVPSTHRNPNYWPSGPGPAGKRDDLDEFRGQRWLSSNGIADSKSGRDAIPQDSAAGDSRNPIGGTTCEDTSAALFRPPRGAYLAFSEGQRKCIGRRFSQVEIMAVLAVVFKSHSLELAVDDFASDEEIASMDEKQKNDVWEQAAKNAKSLLRNGMGHNFTMQLKKGTVPVRLVRRGQGRFL